MRRNALVITFIAAALFACKKKEAPAASQPPSSSTSTTSSAATTSSAPTPQTAAPQGGDDLLSIASGAILVQKPEAPEAGGSPWYLIDEDPDTGWTSQSDKYTQPAVIEMADRSVIKTLSFDEKNVEYDGRIPKDLTVEVSDKSATDGFQPIANITLPPEQKNGDTFPVSAQIPGKWVRLTVKNLHGSSGFAQIMEMRAFGDRLEHTTGPNVTGAYQTNIGFINLKQDGATVTGCFEHGVAPIVGGIEGRMVRFDWKEEYHRGPAIFVVSNDGHIAGGWWPSGGAIEHPKLEVVEGTKSGNAPGTCPEWKPPADAMGSELKKGGRVRLYGINFDSDSDHIRDESKPTLDQVVTMLKSSPDLKITIEGHTDSTSTPEHNQQLSEQRANAVKQYLVGAGIDAARLTATGFGSTKPVATNDTPLGRAANRRVELAKS